jgi:hypothetical protein
MNLNNNTIALILIFIVIMVILMVASISMSGNHLFGILSQSKGHFFGAIF